MNQLNMGLNVEKEHKDVYDFMKKRCKIGKCPSFKQFRNLTVKDHLREDKRYYTKLKKARL